MPVAAVVHLEALADGHVEGGFGRAIHSLWHDHLAQAGPQAGQQLLHQAQTQPFTLSDLMGPRISPEGEIRVTAGDRAWFRVSVLESSLAAALTGDWLPKIIGRPTKLAGVPWAVLAYSIIPSNIPGPARRATARSGDAPKSGQPASITGNSAFAHPPRFMPIARRISRSPYPTRSSTPGCGAGTLSTTSNRSGSGRPTGGSRSSSAAMACEPFRCATADNCGSAASAGTGCARSTCRRMNWPSSTLWPSTRFTVAAATTRRKAWG